MANDAEEDPKTTAGPGAVPGSLHHERPENGGQSQSPAGLESAPSESDTAEPSKAAPPETHSPAVPRFSMEPHAQEGPAAETADPGGVDPAPGIVPSPSGVADAQPKPRSLFPALAATAVAGALLGFGGTLGLLYFGGSQINGYTSGERGAEVNARIDAVEGKEDAALAATRTALSAMETRLAASEDAAGKAAELANSAQADAQKAFASGPAAQEPAPVSAPAGVPNLGPLEARIATLEQELAPLESALTAPKADLRAKPDRENAAAGEGSRAQAIAIVAESLLRKLDSDGQFSGELVALENLGVPEASLKPLRAASASAVSNERQLTAQFAALAPAIIASESANQGSADEGFLGRLTRNAKGLVHIHRVGDPEATDIRGLVERIEKALAEHDLKAAYQAWNELPGPAKTVSESWGEAAQARLDAKNAARSIEAAAVAVLGKPKS